MLHAINQNKSTLYKRYGGYRDLNDHRVCEEDEITSTIIGPMDFMLPDEVHRFWSALFQLKSRPDVFGVLSDQPPKSMKVKLWPSRQVQNGGRERVEPDATIEFIWTEKIRCLLLIEFKWRAPLSGRYQLHRQWNHYLTKEEQEAHTFHLFIAPVVTEGASARNSELGDIWGDRLILITWETFRRALNIIINNDKATTSLGRWSTVADNFLQKIGIKKFVGFGNLVDELNFSIPSSNPLFNFKQ